MSRNILKNILIFSDDFPGCFPSKEFKHKLRNRHYIHLLRVPDLLLLKRLS